jgi:predicted ATPase
VGFGASQLLPIIVAGYYAPEKSLLIAEQPEIHLHPKAQTRLGDLLIDISKENKTLLVETHSEHLIMRIQRRIAEGAIGKEGVALYYCEPSNKGTLVKRIIIDELGQMQQTLPVGFFEESYLESKSHLEAIIEKKSKQNQLKEPI